MRLAQYATVLLLLLLLGHLKEFISQLYHYLFQLFILVPLLLKLLFQFLLALKTLLQLSLLGLDLHFENGLLTSGLLIHGGDLF